MKICLVSEYYYPLLGGITEHVYHFARQCLSYGHQVSLLTSHAGPIDPALIPKGLNIHQMGMSTPVCANGSFARATIAPFLGTRVRHFLSRNSFDIVHIHSPLTPILPLLAAKYKCAPTIGTVHTYFESSVVLKMMQRSAQTLLDNHDGFIAVSTSCIEAMQRYFRFNATIIPNGVDTKYFSQGKRLNQFSQKDFRILFLGRLDPRNDLDVLIRAFIQFRKASRGQLIIAGDGPLKKYYMSLVPSHLRDDIQFVGAIRQERPDYFASVDLFCYPASKASFGITLLEAMSAGVPVVASKIRGFTEVIRDGVDGLLVPAADPSAFATAFETLAHSPNLRIQMGENGRRRAEEFSWDRVTNRILDFYTTRIRSEPKLMHA